LLRVYNPAGGPAGEFRGTASDPALLAAAPAGSPVAWLTLARRGQVLRGHERSGRVAWESPVPYEGWLFQAVGDSAVVIAADGRAISYDTSGHALTQGRTDGVPDAVYPGSDGRPLRVARQGVHLICGDFTGRIAWRAIADGTLGPVAAGSAGVAVLIGKSVAWFPVNPPR